MDALYPQQRQQRDPSERGSVLLMALLGTLILSVLAVSIARNSGVALDVAANYHSGQSAFYATDGGVQALFDQIVRETGDLGRFPTNRELARITAPLPGSARLVGSSSATDGGITTGALTTGPYQGLTASTQVYDGVLTAETTTFPRGEATVSMRAAIDLY